MGAMLVRHEPAGASAVRRQLAADLGRNGVSDDSIDEVVLVATELVGNAIRHAGAAPADVMDVTWAIESDVVLISVGDPSTALPVPRDAGPDALNGRGLRIVETLSSAWGVEPTGSGKRVWARVRVVAA